MAAKDKSHDSLALPEIWLNSFLYPEKETNVDNTKIVAMSVQIHNHKSLQKMKNKRRGSSVVNARSCGDILQERRKEGRGKR